jgi:hypothetical protein
MKENELRVALAQIAPVWLNKQATRDVREGLSDCDSKGELAESG